MKRLFRVVCAVFAAVSYTHLDVYKRQGEESCYIFIDDFHLLTDKRAPGFLCALAGRLPPNVHLILALSLIHICKSRISAA